MGYEIDFLAVGEESSGGDAIALRYGNLHGPRSEQTVVVVDGGYRSNGTAMVEFIKRRYSTDVVDIVVSSHPDQDHISGLEVVLEELTVGQLLMHLPWNHSQSIQTAKSSSFAGMTAASEKLRKSLLETSALEEIARRRNIPIVEPFAGMHTQDGVLTILGPSLDYYESLLPEMAGGPSLAQRIVELAKKGKEAVLSLVDETLNLETLRDTGTTRPSNNSSVILMLNVDDRRALLTADAGIPALERAMDLLESEGFEPGSIEFVQIPHHGSRRNVGPSVLTRMLGPVGQADTHSAAFVSVPKKNPELKHPAKKVTNAFRRRGYSVHETKGVNKWHYRDAPARDDYSASEPVPFYSKVEEESD